MRTIILHGCTPIATNDTVAIVTRLGTGGDQLGLAKRGSEGGVLYAQLVDKGTALFPAPVGLIGGRQGSVKELGARLEGFNVSGRGIKH